jgi:adenylate cyclase
MDLALERLRDKWRIENRELFEIGVGICTGIAALGIVGAEGAMQYSAIGDTTNVAARLQAQSKILGASIIISQPTKEAIEGTFRVRSLGFVELKGKSKPMEVFTIASEKD